MICTVCSHEIKNCTCGDIDERLEEIHNDANVIFKICRICSKHYERCQCKKPEWTTSHDEIEMEDVIPGFTEGIISECLLHTNVPQLVNPPELKLKPIRQTPPTFDDIMEYQYYLEMGGKLN